MDYLVTLHENAVGYCDMDLICTYGVDDNVVECRMTEMPDEVFESRDYTVIGYICPECGEVIYLDDYSDKDMVVSMCPICEYEFQKRKKADVL